MKNLINHVNLPIYCPSCGEELSWEGVNLVCNNPSCKSKSYEVVYKIISVLGCHDIKNIGGAMIDDLINFINQYVDVNNSKSVYSYYYDFLVAMESVYNSQGLIESNFGSVTSEKYRRAIENIIKNPIDKTNFLLSLNLPGIGYKTAKLIAEAGIIENILDREDYSEKFYGLKGVGSSALDAIEKSETLIRCIADKINYRQRTVQEDPSDESLEVLKKVTVTGSLSISRSEFDSLIHEYGWEVDSNVSNSEYLVTNNPDPTSSKGKKAKSLGKEIITEEEFYRIAGIKRG